MNPLISEFSYGYAITDELIHGLGTPITAAPVFPSLYQEGQAGGGYDVMIQRPTLPLFIQFKLSHCLTTQNAAEARAGLLATPYYRMHVRPQRRSNQHAMLLELENQGNVVYYCAPAFHEDHELDVAYLNQRVCSRSIWLWPTNIGPLPDDESHYVAFQNENSNYFYFCSEPQLHKADVSFSDFVKRIHKRLIVTDSQSAKSDRFAILADDLINIASKRSPLVNEIANDRRVVDLKPIERVSVLANVLFGSQLYIATLNETADQSSEPERD